MEPVPMKWIKREHWFIEQVGPQWYERALRQHFKHRAEDFSNPLTVNKIQERLVSASNS